MNINKLFYRASPKTLNRSNKCSVLWLSQHGIVFPVVSDGEESACNAGDMSSIPGPGRSRGDGNGNSLQYSCLENSMNTGGHKEICSIFCNNLLEKRIRKCILIYMYMCVCVYFIYMKLNHFAIHLKLTQHYKSATVQFFKMYHWSRTLFRHYVYYEGWIAICSNHPTLNATSSRNLSKLTTHVRSI